MLAIPPRFNTALRSDPCELNKIRSASGEIGAPSPPAAISRARKSVTTRAPVPSAITSPSPTWSVARIAPGTELWW